MIGLPYGEKNYDDMLSRLHTIPACHGQTDGPTDRIVSVLTCDKNDKINSPRVYNRFDADCERNHGPNGRTNRQTKLL